MSCANCEKDALKKCGGCNSAYYCGVECQKADWIREHQSICSNMRNTKISQGVGPKYKGGSKKDKKRNKDLPSSDYPDVDSELNLDVLSQKWRETTSDAKKKYIVERIKKMNSKMDNGGLRFKGKALSDLIQNDYADKRLEKLIKEYETLKEDHMESYGQDEEAVELEPFYENSVDFILFYDVSSNQIIGPLSMSALDHVNENGKLDMRRGLRGKRLAEDPGTRRSISDAEKVKMYEKDPSKIMIYSK